MLIERVRNKLKDDSQRLTDEADYWPAVEAALARYSKHRPLELTVDLAGTGGPDLALPEGWLADFSRVLAVEYPVGDCPESLLEEGEWSIYRTSEGHRLRLRWDKPETGESVRVTYTALRLEADVPVVDLDAVACLAASSCLRTLAALYGQSSDPTIAADVVNYRSKTDEFRRLADALEERFNTHLGIDPKGTAPAASAFGADPARYRFRMTH